MSALAVAHFVFFGPAHLTVMFLTAVSAVGLCAWARKRRGNRSVEVVAVGLALFLLLTEFLEPVVRTLYGPVRVQTMLPVELCDLTAVFASAALLTRRTVLFEFAYFWAFSGALQAVLTPNVPGGFPSVEFFRYFGLHSGILVGVSFLAWGLAMRPRSGALWRVYRWTFVYAAAVGFLDWRLGANYFYLAREPSQKSLLSSFGGWPYYLFGGAVLAAVFFYLLDLPFRPARRRLLAGRVDP